MPTFTADARFLGLDLRTLGSELRQAWAQALQSPWLSWLTPEAPVLLLQADGATSLWRGGLRQQATSAQAKVRFTALELPEDLLLLRTFTLPSMGAQDTAGAAALQAQSISPFAASDLVWGWRAQAGAQAMQQIDIAIASSKQIAQYLQAQSERIGSALPELWALPPSGAPIMLAGYGEAARAAAGRRGRWGYLGLLALALSLLGGIAITPTLQLRARAIEAVHAYDGIVHRAAPLVQEREQLLQTVEKLNALSDLLTGRIEPLRVLDRLTQVLPDDTALQSFTLKGNKLTLTGLTGNASVVMQVLGQQPGVRDVRAPSPATRTGGANSKENFVVELTLDAQEYGVALAPPAAAAPLAPAAQPPDAPAAPPAPAPEASPPPAKANPQPQPQQPQAADGRRAVFGGSPAAKPAPAPAVGKGTP